MFVTRDKVEEKIREEVERGTFSERLGVCDDCGNSDIIYGPSAEVAAFFPPEVIDEAAVVCFDCCVYRAAYSLGLEDGMYMGRSILNN